MTFITHLKPYQIFVFGSNLQGRHGAGAALQALQFGAERGVGVGLRGQTYAIPTREYHGYGGGLVTLSLDEINRHVQQFLVFAYNRSDLEFLVTPIGTGLAGYTPNQIGPLFMYASANVVLPPEFAIYRSVPDVVTMECPTCEKTWSWIDKGESAKCPGCGTPLLMAEGDGCGDPPAPQEPDLLPPFTD